MTDVFGAIQPTKENIEREMHQLVSGAQPWDTLFFQFSGVYILYLNLIHSSRGN